MSEKDLAHTIAALHRLLDAEKARADAAAAERDGLEAALALGQENCDAVYNDLRAERDALQAAVNEARELIAYVMPSVQPYMVTQLRAWLAAYPAMPAPEQGGEAA